MHSLWPETSTSVSSQRRGWPFSLSFRHYRCFCRHTQTYVNTLWLKMTKTLSQCLAAQELIPKCSGNRVTASQLRKGQEGSWCFDVSAHSTNSFITFVQQTMSHMSGRIKRLGSIIGLLQTTCTSYKLQEINCFNFIDCYLLTFR